MNNKLKLLIFGFTAFLVANTYYDGKYTQLILGWKKYYKMVMIAFGGLSLYLFIKKHPNDSKQALFSASNLVKYIPVDSETSNLFGMFTNSGQNYDFNQMSMTPQQKRMMYSGKNSVSRSVSETKKKYVASRQKWKCGKCGNMLDATYEVDHKIELQNGGTNHVDNCVPDSGIYKIAIEANKKPRV